MSDITPNIPSWVDLGSPDLPATVAFYGSLFGWTATAATEPEAGGYTTFRKDGKAVAGAGPLLSPDQPPVWTTYIATPDAEAVAGRVEHHGGTVLLPPMDVMDYGRMAIFADPDGAVFAAWQAGTMPGAELVNEPGSLLWNELMTRDPDGAKPFYHKVFGWAADDRGGPLNYTEWQVGGSSIAGMMPMVGDAWPATLPSHWMVYFGSDDVDATAARAKELGGMVVMEPKDIPPGRFAVLLDPHGAAFSVMKLA